MYTIWNSHKGSLESAACMLAQANVDTAFLQEVKATANVYTRCAAGYKIVTHRSREPLLGRSRRDLERGSDLETQGSCYIRSERSEHTTHPRPAPPAHSVCVHPPMGKRGIHWSMCRNPVTPTAGSGSPPGRGFQQRPLLSTYGEGQGDFSSSCHTWPKEPNEQCMVAEGVPGEVYLNYLAPQQHHHISARLPIWMQQARVQEHMPEGPRV